MNILQLYQDYGIPFWTEGKNVGSGWINVACPFCQDTSNHLGFNLKQEYFRCWRCGWHATLPTISKLLSMDVISAGRIVGKYGGRARLRISPDILVPKPHVLPSGTDRMLSHHRAYLIKRKFDPEYLEKEWGLLGTGPVSALDSISYKHRIIAPIHWDNQRVSFQARDITGKHPLRYIACPRVRELLHHKHIVYGQQTKWGDVGVCVEGITDVWRLGPLSFATFGIEYTVYQVQQIVAHFDHVVILFDDEPQAQTQAERLAAELRINNVRVRTTTVQGDPGSLDQTEANNLIKSLTRRW